jgi:hypothetical protein
LRGVSLLLNFRADDKMEMNIFEKVAQKGLRAFLGKVHGK